jgi:thioredoxin-related protein
MAEWNHERTFRRKSKMTMKITYNIIAIALFVALFVACKDPQSVAQPTSSVSTETAKPIAVSASSSQNANSTESQPGHEGVTWMTVEQAVAAQKTTPKPIMIDVYTQWCGPCKKLAAETFGDKKVQEYLNSHFYCIRFDGECNEVVNFQGKTFSNPNYVPNQPGRNSVHEFTQFLGVNAYPTLFFMDDAGTPLGPLPGFRGPKEIELFLKYFGEGTYRTVKTQEEFSEYEKNFKGSW